MKKHLHNSLRALFLSLAVLLSLPMLAVEVMINGIRYDLDAKAKQATVIAKSSGNYSGKIVIPKSVEHKGTVYSVTSIGVWAFFSCSGLTSVTIGNNVTSIGEEAFRNCDGLTSVTIPNSVKSIGFGAFYGCSGLSSVTIPNSVTSIEYATFSGCSGLTSIIVKEGNSVYDSRNNCNAIIETATNTLHSGCQTTVIPNSVTSIGDNAFYGCYVLTSVTIPNSVTSIGNYAFSDCEGLTSVTIGNGVKSIGDRAFQGCIGLTSVHISDIAAWCNIDFSGPYFSNPLFYAEHLYLNGEEVKDLVIPNSVTSIGDYAFYWCSGLTSVTIPNSVKSIGTGAFSGCSGLTSVVVEDGNPVYDSRNNCNAIIETSTNTLHSGCKTTIIPNSVTSIEESAFRECSGLTSVTIPNSVTSIGESAFRECSGLTSVTIPNSVESIGESAFYYCSGLTSVTIGSSVTSIGYEAFSGCSELLDVYCYAEKVPSTGTYAFDSWNIKNATLHVPAGSLESYRSTEPWSGFGKIVALTDEETGITETENGNVKSENSVVFDLSGRRVQKAQKGIFIQNGKVVVK